MPVSPRRAVVLATLLMATLAPASSRPYTWTYTTDTGLEGDSGTELWMTLNRALQTPVAAELRGWDVWWGFTSTATEGLELALYAMAGTAPPAGVAAPTSTQLTFRLVEGHVRWHVAEPLLVLGKVQYLPGRGLGGELLAVLEHRLDKVLLTANASVSLMPMPYGLALGPNLDAHANLAGSVTVTAAVRLGVEAFMRAPLRGVTPFAAYAGPTVFYGKGRLWAALNATFGVDRQPGTASSCSRLIVGATF